MGSKPSKPQYQAPQYTQLTLPELRTALDKFVGQEQDFGRLQNTILSSAQKKMDALETLRPGYKAGVDKAQQTADSLAQGLVPSDVANKVSRSSAFKGLMTGLPGQQRQAIEARDLGLTSLDLQGRGLAAQQALRAEANAMMPLQALNLAFSPQAIRQEDVSLAQYNNQIVNRQADANATTYNRQQDMNYQYDQQYGGSPFSGILGGLGGGLAGAGIGFAMGGPAGALMGAGMGAQVGGGIGGSFGGAQGQQFGGIFSGLGSSLAGLGTMYGGGYFGGGLNPETGIYGSRGAAMSAAPYANGYTQVNGGYVPRASLASERP